MDLKTKVKTQIFKALEFLPSSLSYSIYHKAQQILQSNKLEFKIEANKGSFDKFKNILEEINISLEDKNLLEIGSGWVPLMPFYFKYLGKCNKIYTYDLNEHYRKQNVDQVIAYFNKTYHLSIPPDSGTQYNLPDWLIYKPNENVVDADLPKDIDIVFSRFVLEHVPPEQIYLMHKKFKSVYGKDVTIVHLISPSDHRAYNDKSLSLVDFLKYSEEEWNNIQTKFDYHNRLRLPQYLDIFKSVGFDVQYSKYQPIAKDSEEYEKFKKIKVHKDFEHFDNDSLTAGALKIALKIK